MAATAASSAAAVVAAVSDDDDNYEEYILVAKRRAMEAEQQARSSSAAPYSVLPAQSWGPDVAASKHQSTDLVTLLPMVRKSKRASRQRVSGQRKRSPLLGSDERVVAVYPEVFNSLPPPGPDWYLPPGFGFRLLSGDTPPLSPPRKLQETGELRPLNPTICVSKRGSRELADAEARANQYYLDQAEELENADEELCDAEEAKVAFRAFKVKFSRFYRDLASGSYTKRVVSNVARPRDTLGDGDESRWFWMAALPSGTPLRNACLGALQLL